MDKTEQELEDAETNALNWKTYRSLVARGNEPTTAFEKDVRDELVVAYVYLCRRVVGKMKKSMPAHVERDDLESWAKIGLMQAVTRYDETLGVPFEAFATQRMRSVIMDGIRDADWAPRSLRKKRRDIEKIEDGFKQAHGRAPTNAETARIMAFDQMTDETTIDELTKHALALETEISNTKYESDIASHTYIDASVEAQNKPATLNDEEDELVGLLKTVVAHALAEMSVRKAAIISLHYYEEKKLSDIAVLLKMSEVKVGALHSEAVMEIWDKIKEALADA